MKANIELYRNMAINKQRGNDAALLVGD